MAVIKNCLDLVHSFSDRWIGVLPLGKELELDEMFLKEFNVIKNGTVLESMSRFIAHCTGAGCIECTPCQDYINIAVGNATKYRFKPI